MWACETHINSFLFVSKKTARLRKIAVGGDRISVERGISYMVKFRSRFDVGL